MSDIAKIDWTGVLCGDAADAGRGERRPADEQAGAGARVLLAAACQDPGSASARLTGVPLDDALPGNDGRQARLAVQAVAHAAGQGWLSGSSLASLAGFLTTVDEFLRSQHVSARLTAFLSSTGHQHPGYDACLLIDDVSLTAARFRHLTDPAADDQPATVQHQPA